MAKRSGGKAIVWSRLINLAAFVSLALIGLSLLISYAVGSGDLSRAFNTIATVMAFVIVAFYAMIYCLERRRTTVQLAVHLVIWSVAVALIIIFMIL